MRIRMLLPAVLCTAIHAGASPATLTIAQNGRSDYVVVTRNNATDAEAEAARMLAETLTSITGADVRALKSDTPPPKAFVIALDPNGLAPGEIAIRTAGSRMVLLGSRTRDLMNVVYVFLEKLGCRWWAPWARSIPSAPNLSVAPLQLQAKPGFAIRHVGFRLAYDERWAARNRLNRDDAMYAGSSVHTFHDLVPGGDFKAHPEWFSMVDGQRLARGGQLCLANAELRGVVAARVRELLRARPEANIVSISQNDGGRFCQCDRCAVLYRRYGSISGANLEFVNAVARDLQSTAPEVIVETLAYRETLRPPAGIAAADNVAVRVACIECDRRIPLSSNDEYMKNLRQWRAITRHLYIWDYVADWTEYLRPLPNWFVLAANVATFRAAGVENLYEGGVVDTDGTELAELRAWVLAQLLWDPTLDGDAVVAEFLKGYYGASAAAPIAEYLQVLSAPGALEDVRSLRRGEALWRQAERSAAGEPELLWRVKQSHQAIRYVWLTRWAALRRAASQSHEPWPLDASRRLVAQQWGEVWKSHSPSGFHPLSTLGESNRMTPSEFVERLSTDTVPRRAFTRSLPRITAGMPAVGLSIAILICLVAMAVSTGIARIAACASLVLCLAAIGMMRWASLLTFRYAVFVLTATAVAAVVSLASIAGARRWLALFACVVAAGFVLPPFIDYTRARFFRTMPSKLQGARLNGANLDGVVLDGVRLRGATMIRTSLVKSFLNSADLEGVDLRGADLRDAMLLNASLRSADVRGASFDRAQVGDLTRTMFAGALYDDSTRLPAGMNPADWELVHHE